MDASLVYLAGQVVSEYELWDPSSLGRPLEEVLTLLRKGTLLLKHGRQGKPKVHFFRLTASDTVLKWRSASGSVRQVKLRTVTEVVAGQTTEVFKRYMLRETGLSFSLKYTDDDGSHRTLDLTCADMPQYSAWYMGLKVVADRLRVTGTPALPAAAAFAASTPLGGNGSSSFSSLLLGVGSGAAEAQRRYGGGTAVGRASGAMGIPVMEHVPGDLLLWGAASRAPVAPSTRSAPDPDLWQRSKVPLALACNAALDVRCAAVGRLHGILLTSSGSVYTWGEGRGGKLGLGHDQDQASPQRLEQGLRGQCVVTVASGDDCTAAVTEDGTLYMWGRLAGSPRPQLLPVPVRGDLQSRVVTKVSCGPFHCAAVSLDGALFTWGEGFGGKLGHGNQDSQGQPTLVEALVGRQVLNVACGVWHTAAVVVENEGPLGQALIGASPQAPTRLTEQQLQDGAPPRPESSTLSLGHHRRNSSASSVFSEASLFHEGQGGCLYTWGGVNESLYGSNEKRDSNKGCLGHGDVDIYTGQLLPSRVSGALEGKVVRHVAAGLHLTVAVTTGGRVFQMGCTGATPGKHCPWEGAAAPELVKGALAGYFVDSICCGTHHVLALARPLDRRQGRPVEHGATTVFAWGKGSEGQLGSGKFDDSATPLVVEALKGRSVLQVSCGGSNALAVCEHDLKRFEPDSREAADQAMAALYGLMDQKPPKQLRITIPEGYSSGALTTSRARSMVQQSGSSMALVPHSSAGSLSRPSGGQRPLGAGGRPPTISEMYATLRSAQRQQQAAQRGGIPPRRPGGSGRTDPGGGGREPGGSGSSLGSTAAPRVLGVPSGSLRRGSGLGMGVSASMPSLSGISHAPSWGAASELSSISSLRQASEDWGAASSVGGDSQHYYGALGNGIVSASGAFHSGGMDLAAIDETGSAASLNEELNEKNRIIERLESKLHQLRRHVSKVSSHDSEERLWHSVRASAGHFRESFMAAADVGGSVSGRSGRFTALSRPSMTVSDAGTAATGDEEREASLQAMEQMLVRKQVHLESQQHKLMQWAAELQRREMELQRQAQAEGRPFTAPSAAFQSATSAPATLAPLGSPERLAEGVPAPIPSESPIFPRLRRSQAAAANGSSRADLSSAAAAAARPPEAVPGGTHPGQGAGPALGGDQPPNTPPTHSRAEAYGLGTPQQEPSTGQPNGDASEWMEEIEPGVFVTYTIEEGGLRKLKRIRFSRTVFSKDSAAKWYEANKHRLAQPLRAPRPTTHHHFSTPVPLPSSAPPLLHSQATLGSRNLSFDPSELAALHMQAQQHGSKPPSRLSQASRQGEAGFAADHQALQAGGGGLPTVLSEGEVTPAKAPGLGDAASRNGSANGIGQPAEQPPQQDSAPPSPFADRPRSAPAAAGHQPSSTDENGEMDGGDAKPHPAGTPVAAGTVPASPQQQQQLLLADLMSLSRTSTSSAMFGASEGTSAPGSGRSSPSKRSTQQHACTGPAQYRQGALQARPQGLSRELSTASVSSMRSEASRASKVFGQFSPRFAAAPGPMDPRTSPQPAATLAHAPSGGRLAGSSGSASSIAAAMAAGGPLQRLDRQASSTPSSPFAAAAAAGGPFDDGAAGSGGASSTSSRTPQGSMLSSASLRSSTQASAAAAADLSPSPSRFTRLKAAFSSSSKKKDKGDGAHRPPSC